MKIYKIKVNGKTYKVELEAVEEGKGTIAEPSKAEAAPAAAKPTGEGKEVLSPIQGTVVALKAKVGQKVKKGDVILVVEAMKLENDVVSPYDGVVAEILVEKGASVTSKQAVALVK